MNKTLLIGERFKEIVDEGVVVAVLSTWPVVKLDGEGGTEPAKPPEHAAQHFNKYWTPKLIQLIETYTEDRVVAELDRLIEWADNTNQPTFDALVTIINKHREDRLEQLKPKEE